MNRKHISISLAKFVQKLARLRGGGSALPGLVIERLYPQFMSQALDGLKHGVVIISGTNGKTTTTKMVVAMLRRHGYKVFTNPSGSNLERGIAASLLPHVSLETGQLEADIAVIELDEAHAVRFVKRVKPSATLALNVLRDQLDRYGEIDKTAQLIAEIVKGTKKHVVLNHNDPLIRDLSYYAPKTAQITYFGADKSLAHMFPNDSDLHGSKHEFKKIPSGSIVLKEIDGRKMTFAVGSKTHRPVTLALDGVHNALNAAAALALVNTITDAKPEDLFDELEKVGPAFGRGETIIIDSQPVEVVLVKNPSGFRLAIESYRDKPAQTMIAINDNYADGRDMSWLWDVDFTSFRNVSSVSGVRAFDMALRLQYDNVHLHDVDTNIARALDKFLTVPQAGPKRIFCSYTAMLEVRKEIGKKYDVEAIE